MKEYRVIRLHPPSMLLGRYDGGMEEYLYFIFVDNIETG